jgi:hypothetical protein
VSKWTQGRTRNRELAALSRFDVSVRYEDGKPVYRIRPKGFRTVIGFVQAAPGASSDDVLDVGNALMRLASVGAK